VRARTRRRLRDGIAGALVVAAAVVVIVLATGDDGGSSPTPRPSPEALAASNVTAEGWDLPALDGPGRVTHAQFVGRPTVVHFFASTCGVCDDETPLFRSAVSVYGDRVNFVFVDTGDPGDWRPMIERQHLAGLALAADVAADRTAVGDGLYRAVGGTGSLPLTAFYDPDGTLVQVADRALLGGTLRQSLQQLYGIGA
jgi:thiol-disulfide isomerase/thioredoxin